jgi:riboflavin synthase
MFTGIVEALGIVKSITIEGSNKHFVIESSVSNKMKPDESIAHNGVCLTVTKIEGDCHYVTAIEETLIKSNLGEFKEGDLVNLERAMVYNARLDGHMVQGHVDQTATCTKVEEKEGSHYFYFEHDDIPFINVEKGSICVNGVSLTVVDVWKNGFSVAIIPYTTEHTNFKIFKLGTRVNLEYDIIGKYVSRIMEAYVSK